MFHKKRSGYLVMVLALVLALAVTGCTKELAGENTPPPALSDTQDPGFADRTQLGKVVDFKADDGLYLAVAYLGYGEEQAQKTLEQMAPGYTVDGENLLEELPTVECPGEEYYLVIPRYADMAVSVQTLRLDEDGEAQVEQTQQREDAQGFVLKCNASDIFPNSQVVLSYDQWEGEYSPALSLKDGGLMGGEFVLDITDYVLAMPGEETEET